MLELKDKIYWLGIKDWEIKKFHGDEYSTHRGSTYNSYLIKDKKIALVDTVWTPFRDEYLESLERDVGLNNIDLVVVNHTEPDHGGSLGALMAKIPDVPIYCTKNGARMIKRYFHQDWNFNVVKTGDSVDLGQYKLVFVEAPMLHWPDSMLTYVAGANVLLSNDAFGQHYATSHMYNDQVDQCELYQEALKYYANILTPFSRLVKLKIKELLAMNLPVDMICPSHGIIWRDNPLQIVEKYNEWADNYHDGSVVVLYDTMWESTKDMANAIARGLKNKGVTVKVSNVAKRDKNDIITDIFNARGLIAGSPTVNNGILTGMAMIFEEIKGLKFKEKVGAAFGSYGWSGESIGILEELLTKSGIKPIQLGLKFEFKPTSEEIDQCIAFGEAFADKING